MKKLLVPLALALAAAAAHADGLQALEQFVKNARTGRADFTQVVTSPPREGQAARSKTSTGSFEFARPSRFRFDYRKPFQQTLVADGTTLWLYDADLNQVTARRQQSVLGSTPAALIAAAPDLEALRKDFELKAAPDRDGLQWVTATPRSREGQLTSVRVGFRGEALSVLEILDSFGQKSVMSFDKLQLNVPIPAGTFNFTVPKGADVLRQ
ncbi:outer membrane lipoprotein chaperone LolA [Ramlibacter tataouinensis]|uniref:outer membrane lipoprotein chaperone LolA n=1 Tax=Ramlibacter tataouinensis TaxID=94132 RepID=UPI0022F37F83|nr:outer membrane lipoprotein chaperone LolA [Ramlibacter tataouinensis]WBY03438.1 outer membrane lipoprotein chaperone LolA [Ramlibacter tataouinensis]